METLFTCATKNLLVKTNGDWYKPPSQIQLKQSQLPFGKKILQGPKLKLSTRLHQFRYTFGKK